MKLPRRGIINHIRVCRDLDHRERVIYLKLQALRALRARRHYLPEVAAGPCFVLFVCHGNIIRSPIAAAMLRQYLPEPERRAFCIASAGLHANPEGGADARAVLLAREFGISLDDHCPQRLTPELVEQADVIFVMDYRNEAQLLARYPEARHKVFLLGTLTQQRRLSQSEIMDPYNGDTADVRSCYESLQPHIRSLVGCLSSTGQRRSRMARTDKGRPSHNQPRQDAGVAHGDAMRKVLIVSYHFPPDAAVGAIRPAKFAKYLPDYGWQPYVLTIRERFYDAIDRSRMSDVVLQERVFRTQVWPNPGAVYLKLKKWLYYVMGKRQLFDEKVSTYRPPDPVQSQGMLAQLRRFLNSLLGMEEGTLGWVPPAILKAILLVKRYQMHCLYTSGPPHSAHLIGLAMKHLYGTRWVADFRDPWTQCPQTLWYLRSKLSERLTVWMEKQVVTHADKVVSVTERMSQSFRTLYPHLDKAKFITILNGYDPEDFPDLVRSRSNSKFRVSYLGSFYSERTPVYFLKAVRESIEEGTLSHDDLDIRFIGHCGYIAGESVEAMVNCEGLSSVVRIMARPPYSEALRQMADSDLLLLFAPAQPLQIPGKAFEYLASGAPIIAFTSEGATADLIRETERGFVAEPDSVPQIKAALKSSYHRYKMNRGRPRCSSLSQDGLLIYHKRMLTKDLVSVLS